MRVTIWIFYGILVIMVGALTQGCLSDEISTDPDLRIRFSQDTLRFDTVFTTIGSATRSLRILNPNDKDISISNIQLQNGGQTMFRLNVDGLPGDAFSDIRIPAQDSIWVFAEVTIDPDLPESISPFIIEDKILVTVNGNEVFVQLEAFGQNANYITTAGNIGGSIAIPCESGILNWDDPKPYIIYGVVGIQNCEVRIAPGTRIHVHGGIVDVGDGFRNDGFIIVDVDGRITANGTLDQPIIFQGDRLEEEFQETSGQWGGIFLSPGSLPSTMNHVQIKNSIVGIQADSSATLMLTNSEIYNTAGTGLIGSFATVTARNTLFHSNNANCVFIQYGGQYTFEHCTMANFLNSDKAIIMTNRICRARNDAGICVQFDVRTLNTTFTNCVITGNDRDEIILIDNDDSNNNFRLVFNNSAIQIDEILDEPRYADLLTTSCNDCFQITRNDTIFRDDFRLDFHPDTLSTLINKAAFIPALNTDLDGVIREAGMTDIGCYEFVPEM